MASETVPAHIAELIVSPAAYGEQKATRSALFLEAGKNSLTRVDLDRQVERLSKSALLAGLSPRARGEILQFARKRTFVRNEVLFSQGQMIDQRILIQSGRVKLNQVSLDGNEVILWMMGSGDAVGVHAGTAEDSHTCSARALERCETLIWDRKAIHLLLARHPQIKANVGMLLTARLRELEERFCEIASESVAHRLALLLQRLCKSVGKQTKCGIELPLRRQELAQMTGTTLFTVSRVLSRWAVVGLVLSRRGGITVRDPDHLIASSPWCKSGYVSPTKPDV